MKRLIGFALGFAPASFRDRYQDEYLATVGERLTAAESRGPRALLSLAVREIAGAARVVVRLRLGLDGQKHRGGRRRGGGMMLDALAQDLRHAARGLSRNRGFTIASVAVLGLGIGATTAIFSAVNAFFFRPLPFAESERLVLLYETNPEYGWTDATVAPANALDWREGVDAFEDVAMYAEFGFQDVSLHRDGTVELANGVTVTGNFFSVLGVRPQMGRAFRDEETWSDAAPVVMMSHSLWLERFGADPDIVGRTIRVGGSETEMEVVGVMPAGFSFPRDGTELWLPYGWAPSDRAEIWFRRAHLVRAVARLAPSVSHQEADAQLQVVVRRLQEDYPETNSVMGAGFMPVRDFLTREVREPLLVLMGAVVVLLLIACANVANLLLVRGNDRKSEVAVRLALGSGQFRIARERMTESFLIALLGGGVGLGLGWLGVSGMGRLTQLGIDGATGISLDGRVVGFALVAALMSAVVFGAWPAVRGGSGDLHGALRQGGRRSTGGLAGGRAASVLVAAEVALALLLVVGAGLMVRSSWLLRQVDPGFSVEGSIGVQVSVPSARYPGRDQVLSFWDRLTEALEARPGIEAAGTVGRLPLDGASWSSQLQAEGWGPDRVGFEILHRRADAGYFEALGIPLLRGRMFGPADGPEDPLVVVVNETLAREHFPNEDPIGQRIAYDRAATPESIWYEIIGIVGDQRQENLAQPPRAEVFEHRSQDWGRQVWVVMKTSVPPAAVVPAFREVLAGLDPQVPVVEVRPLEEVRAASMQGETFLLTLLGVFGVTALLLAVVGVYGVTAQAARRRAHEIGIRMALGATGSAVVSMILRQGTGVIAVGLSVGLATAMASTRAISAMLYGIGPNDPGTLVAVVGLLGGVALLACYVPARRATRVDPVRSLKAE